MGRGQRDCRKPASDEGQVKLRSIKGDHQLKGCYLGFKFIEIDALHKGLYHATVVEANNGDLINSLVESACFNVQIDSPVLKVLEYPPEIRRR